LDIEHLTLVSSKTGKRTVRINFVLEGELAQFLVEMKLGGKISSYTDGVLRGISLFQREELERKALSMRIQQSRKED
jgi:hypothetical protein